MIAHEALKELSTYVDYYTSPFGVIATLICTLYLVWIGMMLRKPVKTNRLHQK